MIDEIDIRNVRFVEDKIEKTMCRLNNLKKWQPALRFYGLKGWCIYKLHCQLNFLIRVQKAKMATVTNDMGAE